MYHTHAEATGILLITLSAVIAMATFSLTDDLMNANSVLHTSCNLPDKVCPLLKYPDQAVVAYFADLVVFATGAYLIMSSKNAYKHKAGAREEAERKIKTLAGDEKKIYEIVIAEGAAFQSDIVERSGMSKVKVSRILDKLEGRQIIERKRRGMSNVIVAKS